MFAINHAATALVVKKKYPQAPLWLLLVSVQFMELVWVVLNYLGIEHSSTESTVSSVLDVHLSYMPYSHSIFSTLIVAFIAWIVIKRCFHSPKVALAVALAITSHIVLDVLTHNHDIALAPFLEIEKLGLGLYAIPMIAFLIETLYGIFCWWVYKGSYALLLAIVLFNFSNFSFFSTVLIGPEAFLANQPLLLTSIVLFQTILALAIVGVLSRKSTRIKTNHSVSLS